MTCNRLLIQLTKNLLVDYDRYENKDIKVIGYPGHPHSDCLVNDKFDYLSWIQQHNTFSTIKVEGLENIEKIKSNFSRFNLKNIHLFVSQKYGHSFNWHKDNVNVYLHVIKGQKIVLLKNKRIILNPGQGVYIPRHHIHKVHSRANTWALSIGY